MAVLTSSAARLNDSCSDRHGRGPAALLGPRPEVEEDMFLAKDPTIVPCSRPPAPFVELRQILPSRVSVISPFVDQMMRFIKRLSPAATGRERADDIEAALRETLATAIVQPNHRSADKCVHVVCRCSMDGEVFISIRVEGEGPDVARLLRPAKSADHIGCSQDRGVQVTKH
jgi:hypothetical protein